VELRLQKNLNNYLDVRIDNSVIREQTRASIDVALDPIKESVLKLESDIRSRLDLLSEELKTIANRHLDVPSPIASTPTIPKENPDADGNTKPWREFFKMIGVEAMSAVEAQKKENADIRTNQVEIGLQAAKEKGFGK
jgi:hypothetical protein